MMVAWAAVVLIVALLAIGTAVVLVIVAFVVAVVPVPAMLTVDAPPSKHEFKGMSPWASIFSTAMLRGPEPPPCAPPTTR